jgi:group I intron endonuclease
MSKATPICGIYALRNAVNGKIYIGSSRDCARRFGEHITRLRRGAHINAKLQSAWNKHGEANFERVILCSVPNPDDLERTEQQFIDEHRAVTLGYNLSPTAGNTAGWKAPPETRARMSAAAKLRDNSQQVEAMRAATTGRKRPKAELTKTWDTRRANGNDRPTEDARKKMAKSAIARGRYTEIDKLQMVIMRKDGMTLRDIGAAFGVGHYSIGIFINRWMDEHGRA